MVGASLWPGETAVAAGHGARTDGRRSGRGRPPGGRFIDT